MFRGRWCVVIILSERELGMEVMKGLKQRLTASEGGDLLTLSLPAEASGPHLRQGHCWGRAVGLLTVTAWREPSPRRFSLAFVLVQSAVLACREQPREAFCISHSLTSCWS